NYSKTILSGESHARMASRWQAYLCLGLCFISSPGIARAWGFMAHRYINESAVFILPQPLLGYMLPYKDELRDRAVVADQRRAWDPQEAARHFIDLDQWGDSVFHCMPMNWGDAIRCYHEDSLQEHGVLPWHTVTVYRRLVNAFAKGDAGAVCRHAADLGHYLADAHVPLHLCSNYNGQFTGQHGIHALLESRIPEYFIDQMLLPFQRPRWIPDVRLSIWDIIRESSAPLASVFACERRCRNTVPIPWQFSPIQQGSRLARKESKEFVQCYDQCLGGLMGQRLSASIHNVASWWWSAWIEAGQPKGVSRMDKRTFVHNEKGLSTPVSEIEEIQVDTITSLRVLNQESKECDER
ncbi:MAG: zinc dependent phospholipase C family protein, partial [Bacteroidota bacterium]